MGIGEVAADLAVSQMVTTGYPDCQADELQRCVHRPSFPLTERLFMLRMAATLEEVADESPQARVTSED